MTSYQSHAMIDRHRTGLAPLPIGLQQPSTPAHRWACDPLEDDSADDETVTTSTRRLLRLVIAAAEAGGRFARDGLSQDPAGWMLTPRAVFDGRAPIDACQDLTHFNRSIVFHAVASGLDADPRVIDALLDEGGDDELEDVSFDHGEEVVGSASGIATAGDDAGDVRLPRPLLLTCWLDVLQGDERLFAFCAVVTDRPADLIDRVVSRYGEAAAEAEFAVGYDHTTQLATAMVSAAMADTLSLAAADPQSPLAAGLDMVVEQRFVDRNLAA